MRFVPAIEGYARRVFRTFSPDTREEAVAEAVAAALVAYVSLVRRGREELAYPAPMAIYAVKSVLSGRHVGGSYTTLDVMSRAAQYHHGFRVESIDRPTKPTHPRWREALVEHSVPTPADQAAFRIDFGDWFADQTARDRKMIDSLAAGERSSRVAEQFGLSWPRISQLRRRWRESWDRFEQEPAAESTSTGVKPSTTAHRSRIETAAVTRESPQLAS
jgi:hypothetical protein